MKHQRGMTLLEVLVASAILAITLAAMIYNIGQQANNLAYLQDKTQAAWLAQDLLLLDRFAAEDASDEHLTSGNKNGLPDLGKKDGKIEQLGRVWYWKMEVKENASEDMRSLILSLATEPDTDPLFSLRAFRSKKPILGPPAKLPDPAGDAKDNKTTNKNTNTNTNTNTNININSPNGESPTTPGFGGN